MKQAVCMRLDHKYTDEGVELQANTLTPSLADTVATMVWCNYHYRKLCVWPTKSLCLTAGSISAINK